MIAARTASAINQCFDEIGQTTDRNQGADRDVQRCSPSCKTVTVAGSQSTGSNSNGHSYPLHTAGAAMQLMPSQNTHESTRHRQEPALRTSFAVVGTASGELGEELVPEREGLRMVRLTAISVSGTIIGDAVPMTIAGQSRGARFAPSGSDGRNASECTR